MKFQENLKNGFQVTLIENSIVVPNGTIALYLALLGLGVGPGKKVAVPNITMIATINAILWTGAKPVIVDVDDNL